MVDTATHQQSAPQGDPADLLWRLILDQLEPEEREALEARLLEDDDLFESFAAAREEILDAYARGTLSTQERRQVEDRLLSGAEGVAELRFAHALAGVADERAPLEHPLEPPSSGWRRWLASISPAARPAWAAATLGLALATALLAWRLVDLQQRLVAESAERTAAQSRIAELEAVDGRQLALAQEVERSLARQSQMAADLDRQQAEIEALRQELTQAEAAATAAPPKAVSFVLSLAAVVRGVDEPRYLSIPTDADEVRMELDLGEDSGYDSYRVAVRTATGGEVWSQAGLQERNTAGGATLAFTLRASLLQPGDHELILLGGGASGFDEMAFYPFTIRRP